MRSDLSYEQLLLLLNGLLLPESQPANLQHGKSRLDLSTTIMSSNIFLDY